jgi:hypothetical protein
VPALLALLLGLGRGLAGASHGDNEDVLSWDIGAGGREVQAGGREAPVEGCFQGELRASDRQTRDGDGKYPPINEET